MKTILVILGLALAATSAQAVVKADCPEVIDMNIHNRASIGAVEGLLLLKETTASAVCHYSSRSGEITKARIEGSLKEGAKNSAYMAMYFSKDNTRYVSYVDVLEMKNGKFSINKEDVSLHIVTEDCHYGCRDTHTRVGTLNAYYSVTDSATFAQCQLFTTYSLTEIYSKSIRNTKKELPALEDWNQWERNLVMNYILKEELHGKFNKEDGTVADYEPMTKFEHVYDNFREFAYGDELHFALFEDTATGHKYVRVWSYPGDNEYGLFMTTWGEVVATIGDSDIYVNDFYCPWDEE